MFRSLCLRAIIFSAALFLCGSGEKFTVHAQDLQVVTGVIIVRPTVPRVRRRFVQPTPPLRQRRPTRRVPQPMPTLSPSVDLDSLADEMIELGNSLRSGTEPRFAEAERAFRIAARLDPEDARPHAWIGDINFAQQRWAEAEAALRRAIQLDPDDFVSYARLSYLFSRLGRFPEAETAANQVKRLRPNAFYGYCSMGWSKFRNRQYGEAETEYRRAIELSPETAGLHADLGLVLIRRGRFAEAAESLRRAIQLDPASLLAHINLGVALQNLGRLDEAVQLYTRAAAINARAAQPHSNLAVIHYMRGNTERARAEWEEAGRLGSQYALNRVGLMILENRFAEARTELDTFTGANADNADGWLFLGDMRRALNDEAGAREAYSRAARIAPDYARLPRPRLTGTRRQRG
jgi:Flp pilus assembly protein TadD